MRRAIRINGTDQVLELSKVAGVKLKDRGMIHFDQLDDGTWRLIYNTDMIPDFTKITSFEIIREE